MDWKDALQIASPLALFLAAISVILRKLNRVRDHLPQHLPDIRITRVLPAGPPYAFDATVENAGQGPAVNVRCTLDGLPGWQYLRPKLEPDEPAHIANVGLPQSAPIKARKLEAPRLKLEYEDKFGLRHGKSYSVEQVLRADGLFDMKVDLKNVEESGPKFGACQLWKIRRVVDY